MAQLQHAAIDALDPVHTDRAGLAAVDAERARDAAIRQDRRGHRLQKAHPPHAAVTPGVAPGAARAAPDRIAFKPHREAKFQHLGVGQARVRHMGLHHRRAAEAAVRAAAGVEPQPGTGAAGNRFVVLMAGVAEGEIVHRALAGGHHAERAVERVGDAGRGLDIAGDDRCRRLRVEHRARRDDDFQRLQATGVERDVVIDQGAEHIQHGGHADRRRRIEVVRELRRAGAEIDLGAALRGVDADRDADLRAVVERQRERAVAQRRDDAAHRFLGVVLHMAHVGLHGGQTELLDHAAQLLHAFLVRGDLRFQVGDVLRRVARRVGAAREQRQDLGFAQHTGVDELEVVDLHAFLVDARRKRRHRPRRDPADVGVVAARADVEGGRYGRCGRCGRGGRLMRGVSAAVGGAGGLQVHRSDHRHVRQVGAAVVRVVQRVDIARAHRASVARHDGLDRLAHRAQMNRHVRRVGDQVAGGVEQRAREVEPLLDVHRVRGGLQLQPHLLGDVHEQVVEDFEADRVDDGAGSERRTERDQGLDAVEHEVVQGRHAGLPAGLDDGRRVALGNDRRAVDAVAGAGVLAPHQRRVPPARTAEDAHGGGHRR